MLPIGVDQSVVQYGKGELGSRLELRLLDVVDVVIGMNEKTAAVGFPDLQGRIDHSHGFMGWRPQLSQMVPQSLQPLLGQIGEDAYRNPPYVRQS